MSLNIGRAALALGALLAYQNRDKIGDMMRRQGDPNRPQGGGLLDGLAGGGGLNEILDRFRNAGSGRHVDSWVGSGPNEPLARHQVEAAIEPGIIDELSRQTGLSREDLIERITRDLPESVNAATPEGRLPGGGGGTSGGGNLLDDVR